MKKGYLSKRIKVFIIIGALIGGSALAWGARGEYYGYDDDEDYAEQIVCDVCAECECPYDECEEDCHVVSEHEHDDVVECDCEPEDAITSVPGDDDAIDSIDEDDQDDEYYDDEYDEDLDMDDEDQYGEFDDDDYIDDEDQEDNDLDDNNLGDDNLGDDNQGDSNQGDNNQEGNDDLGDNGDVLGPIENTPNTPIVPPGTGDEATSQPPTSLLPPRYTPRPSPIDININPINIIPPSNTFISLEDRVRFSVDTQIEGLPPFITMEMVVGLLLAQDNYGFPVSVGIAQIIQEGGYGSFGPGGEEGLGLSLLAHEYNNLFGIKGTGPAGSVNLNTFEMTPAGEIWFAEYGFRVYNTHTESIMDRSRLLQEVYSDLYYGVTNANEFAWNIGGRWATDINYASSLIRHMINYDLYRLDEMTLQDYNELIGVGRFVHPVPGSVITSPFGFRTFDNSFHRGIDFGTGAHNLPIFAAESGEVIFVGYGIAEGNWIIIDHGDGLYTMYMHNLANFVEVGQEVHRGQQIGLTGTTGNSTGNHLHFQVERNGMAIDPAVLLGFYRID